MGKVTIMSRSWTAHQCFGPDHFIDNFCQLLAFGFAGILFGRMWLAEKSTAAHEHAVFDGDAPFDGDAIAVFSRFAGHLDGHFARRNAASMQQPDSKAADLPRHRRDGVSSLRGHFSGNGQFDPLIGSQVGSIALFDAFEHGTQVVQTGAAPGVWRIHDVSGRGNNVRGTAAGCQNLRHDSTSSEPGTIRICSQYSRTKFDHRLYAERVSGTLRIVFEPKLTDERKIPEMLSSQSSDDHVVPRRNRKTAKIPQIPIAITAAIHPHGKPSIGGGLDAICSTRGFLATS